MDDAHAMSTLFCSGLSVSTMVFLSFSVPVSLRVLLFCGLFGTL